MSGLALETSEKPKKKRLSRLRKMAKWKLRLLAVSTIITVLPVLLIFIVLFGFLFMIYVLTLDDSSISIGGDGGYVNSEAVTYNMSLGYDAKITVLSGITPQQLDSKLGGLLKGKGQAYYNAGIANGIDPAFLAAISIHETGNGAEKVRNSVGELVDSLLKRQNNVGGLTNGTEGPDYKGQVQYGDRFLIFNSIDQSIEIKGAYIKRKYLDDAIPKDTLKAVANIYAPVPPECYIDRNSSRECLNLYWVDGVRKNWSDFLQIAAMNRDTIPVGSIGISVAYPKKNATFTSGFKMRMLAGEKSKMHDGVDLSEGRGNLVYSATDGVVIASSSNTSGCLNGNSSNGNGVVIRAKNNYKFFYLHLRNSGENDQPQGTCDGYGALVKIGDIIKQGDIIGYEGDTGHSKGAHLHFGVQNSNGDYIDPMDILPYRLREGEKVHAQ